MPQLLFRNWHLRTKNLQVFQQMMHFPATRMPTFYFCTLNSCDQKYFLTRFWLYRNCKYLSTLFWRSSRNALEHQLLPVDPHTSCIVLSSDYIQFYPFAQREFVYAHRYCMVQSRTKVDREVLRLVRGGDVVVMNTTNKPRFVVTTNVFGFIFLQRLSYLTFFF